MTPSKKKFKVLRGKGRKGYGQVQGPVTPVVKNVGAPHAGKWGGGVSGGVLSSNPENKKKTTPNTQEEASKRKTVQKE